MEPGGHTHRHLHLHGNSRLHRLAPEAKIAGLFLFVVSVAVTPRTAVWAFVGYLAVVAGVIGLARLPIGSVVARLAAVFPFVAFALLLPLVAEGERVDVGPLSLSRDGLWASWNILAKALLGATAAIVTTATTPLPDLLTGLGRLRLPKVMVAIVSFMFRYLELIVDQLTRMRRAMTARAHDPRWLWQAKPIAASAGTLFVRTYERGERVHGAMLARGYQGAMPELTPHHRHRTDWLVAVTPAVLAAALLAASLIVGS